MIYIEIFVCNVNDVYTDQFKIVIICNCHCNCRRLHSNKNHRMHLNGLHSVKMLNIYEQTNKKKWTKTVIINNQSWVWCSVIITLHSLADFVFFGSLSWMGNAVYCIAIECRSYVVRYQFGSFSYTHTTN